MTVDQKAVADMARIMAALSGEPSPEEMAAPTLGPTGQLIESKEASHIDPGVAAMKDILLRLNENAAPTFDRLEQAAAQDPVLREAMVTDPTPTGARIGSWEIVVHPGQTKRYDVINVATKEPIARDLYIYEAAYGLVKRLNEGVAINDKRVRDLLQLEEEYARNRDDAAVFKTQQKKLAEKGETTRAAIAEDRLDEAQRRANDAHDRLLQLAGLRK